MRCPNCGSLDTQVKDSRPTEDSSVIRRRRVCLTCNFRFTTFERVQLRELVVIKRNGRRAPFDRDKLLRSMQIALRKRPVEPERIDQAVSKIVRELEIWTLDDVVADSNYLPSAPAAAHERIRKERTWREPWQREDASVANYDGVEAIESERGAVLFRRTGERISLLQGVAADEDAARELLLGLPTEATSLHWLNGPAGDPFNAAIGSLGGTQAWRQHEMLLEL